MNTLFIRADSTPQIGTGHVMRCIALAQAWQDRGGKVTFISHCESDTLRHRIIDEGFDFIPIEKPYPDPNDLSQTLAHLKPLLPPPSSVLRLSPWLILDGYHFTPEYQKAIREAGVHLLVIDDMNHFSHYHADILLNQNIHATELNYSCDKDTKLLLGTKYVLLRREFLKYRGFKRQIPEKAKKILVTLGGADPDNVTLKVIKALNLINDPDLEVKIVVGPSNPHIESLKKEILRSPFSVLLSPPVSNMADLMAWADVAISGGGSTCWELAFLGLPSAVITLADNQRPVIEWLSKKGGALHLGWHNDLFPVEVGEILKSLLFNKNILNNISRCVKELVDGEGVARTVMHIKGERLRLRPVCEDDCRLIWEWANDEKVRASAFSSDPIPWEEHVQWFTRKLHDPSCFLFIAVDNEDVPLGQVRVDILRDGEAEIDVSIDRDKRGLGYGALLLSEAVKEVFRLTHISAVHAFIKPNNEASMRAFERAGFKRLGVENVKGNVAVHYIRTRSDEQSSYE